MTETLTLTPVMAGPLVARLTGEVIDRGKVAAFAEVMRAGLWRAGSLMSFYADGRLRDGFHRCLAVVVSGVSIEVWPDTVPWCDDR